MAHAHETKTQPCGAAWYELDEQARVQALSACTDQEIMAEARRRNAPGLKRAFVFTLVFLGIVLAADLIMVQAGVYSRWLLL